MEIVTRELGGSRAEPLLDLARERELAVHLLLVGGFRHQARVLDLGRGDVRERRQEAQVRFLEGPVPDLAVHVDETDDFALVLERRREDGLDAREADRVGQRHAGTRRRVHEDQAVPLLDDLRDERLRQADVVGGHPSATRTTADQLFVTRERSSTTPRSGMRVSKTLSIRTS